MCVCRGWTVQRYLLKMLRKVLNLELSSGGFSTGVFDGVWARDVAAEALSAASSAMMCMSRSVCVYVGMWVYIWCGCVRVWACQVPKKTARPKAQTLSSKRRSVEALGVGAARLAGRVSDVECCGGVGRKSV